MATIKFGIIGDVHYNEKVDAVWNMFSQNEFRRFSTADTRFSNFIATVNAESSPVCAFAIHGGDAVDSTSDVPTTRYGDFNTRAGDLTVSFYNTLGNHLHWMVEIGEKMTWANYFDTLTNHAVRNNPFPNGTTPKAYTFDVSGFRCIVLFYTYMNYVEGVEGDDQLAWLTARLSETELPVIVFSHAYLHTNMHQYGNPSYAYYGSDDTYLLPVRTVLENSKKVQAVFQSHYHRGKSNCIINDIAYISIFGSVLAWNPADNAYYIVEIETDKIFGQYQSRPSIKMTGYGSKGFDYNGNKWIIAA